MGCIIHVDHGKHTQSLFECRAHSTCETVYPWHVFMSSKHALFSQMQTRPLMLALLSLSPFPCYRYRSLHLSTVPEDLIERTVWLAQVLMHRAPHNVRIEELLDHLVKGRPRRNILQQLAGSRQRLLGAMSGGFGSMNTRFGSMIRSHRSMRSVGAAAVGMQGNQQASQRSRLVALVAAVAGVLRGRGGGAAALGVGGGRGLGATGVTGSRTCGPEPDTQQHQEQQLRVEEGAGAGEGARDSAPASERDCESSLVCEVTGEDTPVEHAGVIKVSLGEEEGGI